MSARGRHGRTSVRLVLSATVLRALLLAVLWWAVAEGAATAWPAGVVVVAAACATSLGLAPPRPGRPRLRAVPAFFAWFVVRSLVAGVDVARRALGRHVDVCPGTVDVAVRLPAGLPLVTLADVASLLPGTLTVEDLGVVVRMHVLDTRAPVAQQMKDLETRVAALYGLPLP